MKKRPSQGTHRSRPRKGVVVGGRRRLKEDLRRLKCQKNGEVGFREDWWRLRSARRRQTSLLVEAQHQKVGHPPSRADVWDSGRRRKAACGSVFGSGSLRKVADIFFAPHMMWSMSKNIVGKMLMVMRVFWPRYGWSESFGRWKRWSEWDTVTRRIPEINYTGKPERIKFSLLALIPCWKREREKTLILIHVINFLQ